MPGPVLGSEWLELYLTQTVSRWGSGESGPGGAFWARKREKWSAQQWRLWLMAWNCVDAGSGCCVVLRRAISEPRPYSGLLGKPSSPPFPFFSSTTGALALIPTIATHLSARHGSSQEAGECSQRCRRPADELGGHHLDERQRAYRLFRDRLPSITVTAPVALHASELAPSCCSFMFTLPRSICTAPPRRSAVAHHHTDMAGAISQAAFRCHLSSPDDRVFA